MKEIKANLGAQRVELTVNKILIACLLISVIWNGTSLSVSAKKKSPPSEMVSAEPRDSKDSKPKPYSKDAVDHYNKGVDYHTTLLFDNAMTEYKAAIAADDRMNEVWSNLGGVYEMKNMYKEAIDAHQHAVNLTGELPNSNLLIVSLGHLADAYQGNGDAVKAAECRLRAIALQKSKPADNVSSDKANPEDTKKN